MYNASTNAVVVYDGKESMPCRNDLNAIITCLYLTAIMALGGNAYRTVYLSVFVCHSYANAI